MLLLQNRISIRLPISCFLVAKSVLIFLYWARAWLRPLTRHVWTHLSVGAQMIHRTGLDNSVRMQIVFRNSVCRERLICSGFNVLSHETVILVVSSGPWFLSSPCWTSGGLTEAHDVVVTWKRTLRDWHFVRGVHRSQRVSNVELWCFPFC